jgi:hypothetical protein
MANPQTGKTLLGSISDCTFAAALHLLSIITSIARSSRYRLAGDEGEMRKAHGFGRVHLGRLRR